MQGKGLIKFFAVALVVVCLYQLSFTYITYRVEQDAQEFAERNLSQHLDPASLKERFGDNMLQRTLFVDSINTLIKARSSRYLDSIRNEVVYDLWVQDYTYKRCKELEINLGLDLRGGMSVTLQVAVDNLIIAMSNYNDDAVFREAIEVARERQRASQKDFTTLFGEAYEELAPQASLAAIFATRENQEYIGYNSTNAEVLDFIRAESKAAIKRTFNIIRTRIDRYGVSQPNISLQEGTGRIIVELPGVDNPDRVRNLLQTTAQLEFWETWDNEELINNLSDANDQLRQILDKRDTAAAEAPLLGGGEATDTTDTENGLLAGTEEEADLLPGDTSEEAGGLLGESEEEEGELTPERFASENPLFAVLQPAVRQNEQGAQVPQEGPIIGYARGKDTTKVNEYLRMEGLRTLFPRNIKFRWGAKAINEESDFFALYAIKTIANEREAPLQGDVITDARQDFDRNGQPEVSMTMNTEGARKWKRMTSENVGRSIAIVLDDYVYSAPRVQNEIAGGRSSISGNFTITEAKDLANILKAGKFPAPAQIVEEEIVGPSLGAESIRAGTHSLLVGLLIVLIFMVFYYGMGGVVSNAALFLNLFFIMGVLASLGATLTLPGIAGIVLTIGMAVDANVIIYERIREELAKGKGLRLAIIDGYKASYSAIIDANTTTMLTAIILAYFGSGPILGFATVLIIGIISSLFTAVLLTQVGYDWLIQKDKPISFATKLTAGAFSNLNFDFVTKRKFSYIFSGAIITVGLISMVGNGFELGVDFKGGRSYVVRFDEPVTTGDIRKSLAERLGEQPLVRTFGSANQVKITTSYLIDDRTTAADSLVQAHMFEGLQAFLAPDVTMENYKVNYQMSSQKVGPTIAEDIKRGAYWATIFGLLVIFLYILIRFRKWQYGMGAVAAVTHDVLIVLGLFSMLRGVLPFSLEIDQAFIAALLTIIGYSINDTVVIFDRIREYLNIHPTRETKPVINMAVNQTLSRTLITSLTTTIVVLLLFIFGGEVIRGFAFALLVGIITGTYSSVFIATPVMIDLSKGGEHARARDFSENRVSPERAKQAKKQAKQKKQKT